MRAASITLWTGGPEDLRQIARRLVLTKREMPDPRRSTTRPHRVLRTVRQRSNQWLPSLALARTMILSRFGTSSNRGAATGPATIVKRALGISSARRFTRPDDSTASPIRLEVMNRIGNAPRAIGPL